MALIDKVISYYKLDELSGNAIDVHSTRDFTAVNNPGSAPGILNTARDYNGTTQNHVHPDDPAFSFGPGDSFFVSAWVNPDTIPENHTPFIVAKSSSGRAVDDEWLLSINSFNSNRVRWQVFGNSGFSNAEVASNESVPTGSWTHLIGECDSAGTIRLWFNNGTAKTQSFPAGCWDGTRTVTIATSHNRNGGSFSNFLNGKVDEFGIFSGTSTAEDRNILYGGGTPTPYPWGPVATPVPVIMNSYRRRRALV